MLSASRHIGLLLTVAIVSVGTSTMAWAQTPATQPAAAQPAARPGGITIELIEAGKADKVPLKLDIAGRKLPSMETVARQTIQIGGPDDGQKITQEVTTTMLMEAGAADENGVYPLTMTFDGMSMKMSMPGMEVDTADPDNADNPITKMMKAIGGIKTTVMVDADGNIVAVRGLRESLRAALEKSGLEDGEKAQAQMMLGQMLTDENMKQNAAQFLLGFPAEPVGLNGSWRVSNSINMPGMGRMNSKTTYTVTEITDATITLKAESEMTGMANGTQKGTIVLDRKTGLARSNEQTQTLTVKAMGQEMKIEGTTIVHQK